MSEKDLVSLVRYIAAGDQVALHSIYERAHRIVFTLMVRMTNNRETAVSNGPVVGWIMNQARSRAIDRLRFEQRKKRVNAGSESPRTENASLDPHDVLTFEEQTRLLKNALDSLNPDERQAIEIAFFSELTHQEVAARLNQPLGTIKTRIRSGLVKLRRMLAASQGDV